MNIVDSPAEFSQGVAYQHHIPRIASHIIAILTMKGNMYVHYFIDGLSDFG